MGDNQSTEVQSDRGGLRFDATITLGDMVMAILLFAGGLSAYWSVASRVSVLEDYRMAHAKATDNQIQAQKESLTLLRDDVRDVQRSVNALTLLLSTNANSNGNGGRK